MSTDRVRYLSLEWIDALGVAVAADDRLGEVALRHRLGFTQVVTDGPEGTVTYHLQVGDGRATFGAGPADPEDIRFEQDWDTAVAVATGRLNAQQAFITGRIRLHGDREKLTPSLEVFAVLDGVFESVRRFTDYT